MGGSVEGSSFSPPFYLFRPEVANIWLPAGHWKLEIFWLVEGQCPWPILTWVRCAAVMATPGKGSTMNLIEILAMNFKKPLSPELQGT